MIDPDRELAPTDLVSLPAGVVNNAYKMLADLPAHRVFDVLVAIRQAGTSAGDRVVLPVEVVNTAYAVLSELPAHRVLDLMLAIRNDAEALPTTPASDGTNEDDAQEATA